MEETLQKEIEATERRRGWKWGARNMVDHQKSAENAISGAEGEKKNQ